MHANARLTPMGRLTLVMRIASGRPIAHVAAEMGVSRPTAYKWWHRFEQSGRAGLGRHPPRPKRTPNRTPPEIEAEIRRLRCERKLGPARIAGQLRMHPSTVHRVLVRLRLNRLCWLDRPTGRVIRRIHTTRPGELVHIDVKKLGRIPTGGGWRIFGHAARPHRKRPVGFDDVHSAVDAYSRLAYSEICPDERADACAGFLARARSFFGPTASHRTGAHRQRPQLHLVPVPGRPGRHRAPAHPSLHAAHQRQGRALQPHAPRRMGLRAHLHRKWPAHRGIANSLHTYNHHRFHTAIGGPPVSRVNNPAGYYS